MSSGQPDDWADDLAAGTLSRDRLAELAAAYASDPGAIAARAQVVAKRARAAELDRQAGQAGSAQARAGVVVAAADAMLHELSTRGAGGFLGKLVGIDDRVAESLNAAAAQSHVTLGGLARDRGDLTAALRECTVALEAARRMRRGDLAAGVAMLDLGRISHLQGGDKEAEDWLRQAHPLLLHAQGAAYVPLDTYFLGLAQAGQQRWDEAIATLEEAERGYSQHNLPKGVLDARLARVDVLIRSRRFDDARPLATKTAEMADKSGLPTYMAQARWHLSRLRRAEDNLRDALDLIGEAIKLYRKAGDSWHQAQAFMVQAEIQQGLGMVAEADHSLDEAMRIATAMKSPFLEADCVRARAKLRLAAGNTAEARRALEDARSLYAKQGREEETRLTTAELEKLTTESGRAPSS
jgi:tetratricopeptide (TPR) repeat protein